MDFNEKDFDEYHSEEEEEKKEVSINMSALSEAPPSIFKPFKPGIENDLRELPASAQQIETQKPFSERNVRKLPDEVSAKQKEFEAERIKKN